LTQLSVWYAIIEVVSGGIITTGATSEAGTAYPSGAPGFTPWFQWDSCYSIFSFMYMFWRSWFVLLSFFYWPWCCLFFLDLRVLTTPLLSSNSSHNTQARQLFLSLEYELNFKREKTIEKIKCISYSYYLTTSI
jgi:hypothetical protein